MEEHIDRMDALISEDQQIPLAPVAAIVGICYGTAHVIVHDGLGYREVSKRWMPKQTSNADLAS